MTTFVWCMAGWALGWIAFGRPRPFVATRVVDDPPPVHVVIPARDEEQTLALLLGDLERHRPPGCSVVVVDDCSTDRTAEVAATFPDVSVLRTDGPPPGWHGKAWACQLGSELHDAPLLCFLDADVRLAPGAIELMADQVTNRGGLVSVQPFHTTQRPYEQASALFNVISVMGLGMNRRLFDGPPQPRGAFGPAMMTRRADYDLVGGHAAVAAEVVEDLALAERYRQADRDVSVLPGRGIVAYRMYPGGFGSLVEGWTKNFAQGAGATPLPVLLAIVAWIAAAGTTFFYALDALAGTVTWLGPAVAWVAFTVQLRTMFRVVGSFGWFTAAAYPLLLVIFLAVFARSLWSTLVRRQVRWRGRDLRLGSRR